MEPGTKSFCNHDVLYVIAMVIIVIWMKSGMHVELVFFRRPCATRGCVVRVRLEQCLQAQSLERCRECKSDLLKGNRNAVMIIVSILMLIMMLMAMMHDCECGHVELMVMEKIMMIMMTMRRMMAIVVVVVMMVAKVVVLVAGRIF